MILFQITHMCGCKSHGITHTEEKAEEVRREALQTNCFKHRAAWQLNADQQDKASVTRGARAVSHTSNLPYLKMSTADFNGLAFV